MTRAPRLRSAHAWPVPSWDIPSDNYLKPAHHRAISTPLTAQACPVTFLFHRSPNRLPMLSSAIRFVASRGSNTSTGSIQLLCRVKPGVSAKREGVLGIRDNHVEVCVAARAKEGEANKAVIQVIAETSSYWKTCIRCIPNEYEALKVPKSDVNIIKGSKGREKIVMVGNIEISGTPEEHIEKLKISLHERAST